MPECYVRLSAHFWQSALRYGCRLSLESIVVMASITPFDGLHLWQRFDAIPIDFESEKTLSFCFIAKEL